MGGKGTKWLGRKTWLRLVELYASGRISRQEFTRLKGALARERASLLEPPPRPPLRLAREDGRPPRLRYLFPWSRQVA